MSNGTYQPQGFEHDKNFTLGSLSSNPIDLTQQTHARKHPKLVALAMENEGSKSPGLIFRPHLPGDLGHLSLRVIKVKIGIEESELLALKEGIAQGALTPKDLNFVFEELQKEYQVNCPESLKKSLLDAYQPPKDELFDSMQTSHALEKIALVAIRITDRLQKELLKADPLSEYHFIFSVQAKVVFRLGWEAMAKHGRFPLPPKGPQRLHQLREKPSGAMHFVSASDTDAGFFYTMGIALSPEAQALDTIDVSYGLDGELIVPGQAVSPIPPTLAMATRMFAASIPTSSNISEDIQSIPFSNFAHPGVMDITPARGFMFTPMEAKIEDKIKHAQEEIRRQYQDYLSFISRTSPKERDFLPDVGTAIDISHLPNEEIVPYVKTVLKPFKGDEKKVLSLFLLLDPSEKNEVRSETEFKMTARVKRTCAVVDAAKSLGIQYVSVCDQDEDEWLPNLLEYYSSCELNYLANYTDEKGIILCDGRPVDPVYTASTAAQRIQSVFTSLSVDILKMGMWLCLDALSARRVWYELQNNPHIFERMFLMPIGIVEPYSGFVDNRDKTKTPRAIIDPFEKIKFMIEEAKHLGMPSLLTDTRHKARWVLLGSADGDLQPHLRESIGATPLIGKEKFMACEKLARDAGIILGQAGSIESDQIFWIISDTVFDAAQEGKNPATAFWTAETERVFRRPDGTSLQGNLQSQRRAFVQPFLSVFNRAMESHAKVDGWLRFLNTKNQGDEKARMALLNKKEQVYKMVYACLDCQDKLHQKSGDSALLTAYQNSWDTFSQAFREYHSDIKNLFKSTQEKVAHLWKK